MKTLLDWLRPSSRRAEPRRETDGRLEANDQALARLADDDPVYAALADHAYAQANQAVQQAIKPGLSTGEREFYCGTANALISYLDTIEHTRERAREVLAQRQAEQERRQARKGA